MKRLLPVLMGFVFLLLSSTEGWSLPPCPESGVWNNCFGTHTYTHANGEKYVGEWKDDKKHGQALGSSDAVDFDQIFFEGQPGCDHKGVRRLVVPKNLTSDFAHGLQIFPIR